MGKRVQIRRHLRTLGEIRGILNALKNLSLVEIKRLGRFHSAQKTAAETLERAVSDFMGFHPASAFPPETGRPKVPYLLIGSERGFCGGFNEALIEPLGRTSPDIALIVVGQKLASKLAGDGRVVAALDGPSAASEVPQVIVEVVQKLSGLAKTVPGLRLHSLSILSNEEKGLGFETNLARPFERFLKKEPRKFPFPPLLNLESAAFFRLLTDHYLFSKLHEIFYLSLMAEHRQRIQHMEGATRHMDKEIDRITLRLNELRQEEITEEIEVILLGAAGLSGEEGG